MLLALGILTFWFYSQYQPSVTGRVRTQPAKSNRAAKGLQYDMGASNYFRYTCLLIQATVL